MKDLFLGLDCSTQGITALIIEEKSNSIIFMYSLNFDNALPQYHTKNGVISFNDKTIHSNPLMWVEALELIFENIRKKGIELDNIKAISGSAQQHGTVYLNRSFEEILLNLNPDLSLTSQLKHCFSRKTSPIWMDSSTSSQCEEIRQSLGGMETTIQITGSNTYERFSGPQIRKFFQEDPDNYRDTFIIHLVSSFMASLLIGKNAPIDHCDGSGMNLMNIHTKEWDDKALNATAPNLKTKLPNLCGAQEVIGKISPYHVKRHGFNPETLIIAWSGDNPNSLIGIGLINKGKAGISLGTSDTYFSYLKNLYLDVKGEGHVFGAPTGDYMSLICFKNGSLTREHLKESWGLTWKEFSNILMKTPPGNRGKIMLPYYLPEIVPLVLNPQIKRFGFDQTDKEGNVRGIIEAQFLSMRLHSQWIQERPIEIYVTGGASVNEEIIQVLADVFGVKIYMFEFTNSAALGAALRSIYSYTQFNNQKKSWESIVKRFLEPHLSKSIIPRLQYKKMYDDMLKLYDQCESYFLRNGDDPEPYRKHFIDKYF